MTVAADLVAHIARFGRALRRHGVPVSLRDEVDGVEALTHIDIGDRDEVRRALRTALKIQPRHLTAFDALFARMWSGYAGEPLPPALRDAAAAGRGVNRSVEGAPAVREAPTGNEPGYSPVARLKRKPFDECSAADLIAMEHLMRRLVRRVATRPSRRRVPVHFRGEVDLRRSFRLAASRGGDLASLARRGRRIDRPRLTVLADTSGSMDPNVRFLLAFVRALRRVARQSDVFAFNTALVRLANLDHLEVDVPDWSGGTRIGECLSEFVDRHLDATVDSRTVVLIISDGLDRGDVAPLAAAMQAISRRARRVLWLNPLAGDARYEPTARAMAAALPYVDRLLPAHNLASLEQVLWAFR